MKLNNINRLIPFLITLIIIIFLKISNQREYTKLKILIWNTPLLSLGTYLALSTGTGFTFSYILTTNLARINKSKSKTSIKYKYENLKEESNEFNEPSTNISYENTLIERDLKDPSPTINASFRVIGKNNRINESLKNHEDDEYDSSFFSDQPENSFNKEEIEYKNDKNVNTVLNDWNNDDYSNW